MSGLLLLRRSHLQPLSRCLSSGGLLSQTQRRRYALIGKPQAKGEPAWALPSTPARTRFAPSPTGYLHLGSLRTALFNYLLSQATGGQFILRLEDTDQARFVHDAEQRLYEDLQWAGLNWDEGPDKGGGFGPYKQSLRLDLYKRHAQQLLESGRAFRCFCSKDDLEFNVKQATASGSAAHYPGTCRGIEASESDRRAANGEPHTVRFKAAEEPVAAPDLVYGAYKKAEREDDFIIMKSDGFPTYHFANVVDDHFMDITHVIRGAEWLISTPKHVELYNAFGWQPPNFAHVGLLVDQQRQKLSKRDIDNIGVSVYRQNNILPEALLNYAVLLGWDPNLQKKPNLDKRGVMTVEEMRNNFTLKFTRGDIVVDLAKLKYFQTRFTRDLLQNEVDTPSVRSRIAGPILKQLETIQEDLLAEQNGFAGLQPKELEFFFASVKQGRYPASRRTEEYVTKVLQAWKGPVDNPFDWVCRNIWAFYPVSRVALRRSFLEMQQSMARIQVFKDKRKKVSNADISKVIHIFKNKLREIEWNEEAVGDATKKITDAVSYYDTDKEKLKDKSAGWKILRWALFNGESGLAVVPMMLLLGREETLKRLSSARKAARTEEDALCKSRKSKIRAAESHEARNGKVSELIRGDDPTMPLDRYDEERNVVVRMREEELSDQPSDADLKGPFVSRPPERTRREPKDVNKPYRMIDYDTWSEGKRSLDLGGPQDGNDGGQAQPYWNLRASSSLNKAEDPGAKGQSAYSLDSNVSKPLPKPPANETGPFRLGEPIPNHKEHVQHIRELNIQIKQEREARRQLKVDNNRARDGPARDLQTPGSSPHDEPAPRPQEKGPMWSGSALGGLPDEITARKREEASASRPGHPKTAMPQRAPPQRMQRGSRSDSWRKVKPKKLKEPKKPKKEKKAKKP